MQLEIRRFIKNYMNVNTFSVLPLVYHDHRCWVYNLLQFDCILFIVYIKFIILEVLKFTRGHFGRILIFIVVLFTFTNTISVYYVYSLLIRTLPHHHAVLSIRTSLSKFVKRITERFRFVAMLYHYYILLFSWQADFHIVSQ
jgi:hypothetical protein